MAIELRLGYLVRNMADALTRRVASPRDAGMDPEQLLSFLTHVHGDRLYALWLLVTTTGMRRAELAGLRWTRPPASRSGSSPATSAGFWRWR